MEVLNSILLSTHELWFSDASGLNDKNELTEFLGKLERATKRVDNPEYNEKQKAFFEKVYSAKDDSYPFIMCFSTNRDDAAQWERYADNAKGVCIKFNQPLLEMLLRKTSLPVFFQEVFYVHDIREHAHYKNVVDLLEKGYCEGFDEDGLIGNIIATAPNFKHIECEMMYHGYSPPHHSFQVLATQTQLTALSSSHTHVPVYHARNPGQPIHVQSPNQLKISSFGVPAPASPLFL